MCACGIGVSVWIPSRKTQLSQHHDNPTLQPAQPSGRAHLVQKAQGHLPVPSKGAHCKMKHLVLGHNGPELWDREQAKCELPSTRLLAGAQQCLRRGGSKKGAIPRKDAHQSLGPCAIFYSQSVSIEKVEDRKGVAQPKTHNYV